MLGLGHDPPAIWLGFTALVATLLILDLGVLNRRSHVLSFKEAMTWSFGLIAFALLFGLFILWREGSQPALEYYTGYLIELSLSVDNLFVFILIFSYFGVPAEAQPKVLYRSGRLHLRDEQPPDPDQGRHMLVVVSAPDVWIVNRADATGRHFVDPDPTPGVHAGRSGKHLQLRGPQAVALRAKPLWLRPAGAA